jgi:GAF domain-containing protein
LLHMTNAMDSLTAVEIAERTAVQLGQVTPCFVASVLIVSENRGQLLLHCCRPVDELFLRAVQQRTLSSYQLCVGAASAAPTVQVTVRGDLVPGPYETPRSMLTMPILTGKRIAGIMAIASVFPDAFDSDDLCKMSAVSARASSDLGENQKHA